MTFEIHLNDTYCFCPQVKFPQGIEILDIFKNYPSKTSILDDFDFYESRQKMMQEKKVRLSVPRLDQIQIQVFFLSCFFLLSSLRRQDIC